MSPKTAKNATTIKKLIPARSLAPQGPTLFERLWWWCRDEDDDEWCIWADDPIPNPDPDPDEEFCNREAVEDNDDDDEDTVDVDMEYSDAVDGEQVVAATLPPVNKCNAFVDALEVKEPPRFFVFGGLPFKYMIGTYFYFWMRSNYEASKMWRRRLDIVTKHELPLSGKYTNFNEFHSGWESGGELLRCCTILCTSLPYESSVEFLNKQHH